MTTRLKLGENITEGVTAKLKAGWAARAAVVNSDWADDVVIAAPDPTLFFGGRVQNLPACPACFVMEGQTTFQGEGATYLLSSTEVLVYVFDEDYDGPRLAKRLQRQVRAVIETVYADAPAKQVVSVGPFASDPSNAIFQITPVRTIPGTVFQPEAGDQWRAFYVVVFKAQQDEGPY
jgi:hypothetical protein